MFIGNFGITIVINIFFEKLVLFLPSFFSYTPDETNFIKKLDSFF
ncbi:hypothetical protein WH5701_16350 [Synechococcus sp. WH 5701]|nr:hypothetical protein WH5701_16350 [Synechococcus sp. WH 5701]